MNDQEEEDYEEQVADNVEVQQEANEEYIEDNSPTYQKPESLFSLFRDVLHIDDSSKVANLDRQELGMLDISVRDYQRIALVAETLGHKGFAKWMNQQAQIVLTTSASKKGWFTELFVSAKKFSSKEKRMGLPDGGLPPPSEKKGFWSRIRGR